MANIKKKFFFTQISAPIIGLGSWVLSAYCIGKYFHINKNLSSFRDWFLVVVWILELPLSMFLWGRIWYTRGF